MTETGDNATTEKNLKKYKNALRIAYEDGVIIPEEKDFLELKKKKLEITDKQHLRLEIEVLLELGRQALDRERLDESIVFINQIIERGEADLEIYELLTCLNVMGGEYEKGKESIAKCVELAAKEEAVEEPGDEVPDGPVCPDCSTSIRHIEQYDRWYCDACKKYLAKDFKPGGAVEEPKVEEPKTAEPEPTPAVEEKTVEPSCPDCSGNIRHVAQYDRWYCDACKKYMAKDFKPGEKKEEPAAAPVEPKAAEPEPEPKAAAEPACTDCSGKIRHVAQYDRWYCDACKKYMAKDFKPGEKKEEKEEPKPAAEPKPAEPKAEPKAAAESACPDCGGKIRHIAQYDRYYCDACKKYMAKDFKAGEKKEEAPAAVAPAVEEKPQATPAAEPVCTDCSGKIRHIAQYDRWYCDACKKYMAKGFKAGEKQAAPAAAAPQPEVKKDPACTDCNGKIRHIAQYDRWYCDACKKYMPTGFKA